MYSASQVGPGTPRGGNGDAGGRERPGGEAVQGQCEVGRPPGEATWVLHGPSPVSSTPATSLQASVLQNLRSAMRRQMRRHASRRGPSRRRLGRLWNRLFHRPRAPRGQIPLLSAARTSQTVLGDGLLHQGPGATPDAPAPPTDPDSPGAAGDEPPRGMSCGPEAGPSGLLQGPESRSVDRDSKAPCRDAQEDSHAPEDPPREPSAAPDPAPLAPIASSAPGSHPVEEALDVCRSPLSPCSPALEASDDEALLVC